MRPEELAMLLNGIEHSRSLDYDRQHPGFRTYYAGRGSYAGFAFNTSFARAMMQAALAG